MKWVAFFSQTGNEILNLISGGFTPSLIITNSKNYNSKLDDYNLVHVDKIDEDMYREHMKGSNLVTLHGWLRIIPENICNDFNIFNGHPGLISEYPELKGKDPQVRFFENISKYEKFGCVIHKVSPIVDDGDIYYSSNRPTIIASKTLDDYYIMFSQLSLYNWYNFLKCYFNKDKCEDLNDKIQEDINIKPIKD